MNKSKWIIIGIIAVAVYAYYDEAKQKEAFKNEQLMKAIQQAVQQQQSAPQTSSSGERLLDKSSAGYYYGPVSSSPTIEVGSNNDITPSSSSNTMSRSEQLELKHRMERDLESETKAAEMASRSDASMNDIRYYQHVRDRNNKLYGSGSSR